MTLPSTLVAAQRLSGHEMADNKMMKENLWCDFSYFNVRDDTALNASFCVECGEVLVFIGVFTPIVKDLIIWSSHFYRDRSLIIDITSRSAGREWDR